MPAVQSTSSRWRAVLFLVFFASGITDLAYEVLWMRTLRPVFGSGAQAAATTLAVYFTGLAAGSAYFGRRAASDPRPLSLYARLEVAIATAALLCFLLPWTNLWIYQRLITTWGPRTSGLPALRVALAFAFLLPPAFVIGGTLPVMGEVLVRTPRELAATTGTLYAVNAAGAALGALVAGFWLPVTLGIRGSYAATIAVTLALACVAAAAARRRPRAAPARATPSGAPFVPRWLAAYAFLGGFAALALEVLWTRLLALVLNGSVYAFSAILAVFLAALAMGGLLSAWMSSRLERHLHLFVLLLGASLAIGTSPFLLQAATGGLGSIPTRWGFAGYMTATFGVVVLVVLPPAALCGAVLPTFLRWGTHPDTRPGAMIGALVAINTVGGVFGALAAGFVLLPHLGVWRSLSGLALLYAGLSLFAIDARAPGGRQLRTAALVAAVLLGTFLDPSRLPLVRTDPGETVERVWETPRGIVAVTTDASGRRIRVDNTYVLGGTEGRAEEELQAELPLALHGHARRVFFIGLGTGITAAAALRHPVQRVTATEVLPEVIEASRAYFKDVAGPLYTDPRAEILATDGRLHLASTTDTWDLIVSDLFVPWHEAAGSLYTREHFQVVHDRLAPEGLFVQWLPLFQLTRHDFDTIAHTLTTVFEDVELWVADLRGGEPIAALAARRLAPEGNRRPVPSRATRLGGNLASLPVFDAAPINTDDFPVLEHDAPRALARVRAGEATWLVGTELERLARELESSANPPAAVR